MSAARHLRRIIFIAVLLPLPLWASEEPVALNFRGADINDVVQAIGRISGRNFLVDPRVKGKLDIVTHTPVSPAASYPLLLSALRLQGYAAVEEDGLTKIVPEADAKTHAVPVLGMQAGDAPRGDRMVTRVFSLRHESASQMAAVLRPLVSNNNTVSAFPANNTLIVTDYAENIDRIAAIVAAIDIGERGVTALELQHAVAADLAPVLARLLTGQNGGGNGAAAIPQIVAEPRTNSLLVQADSPERLAEVRRLVATLDRPGAGGDLHVVYLRNADATQVAATLNAALSGEASAPTAQTRPLSAAVASETDSGTAGTATPSRSDAASSGAGSGQVQADAVNNALIIRAPDAVYRNLRHVIEQLDRRRAQVYIEALIAEISTERAAEFGIQWVGGASNGSIGAVGGTGFSSGGGNLFNLIAGTASGNVTLPGNGLNLAIGGGKVTVPGIGEILSLGVLARFLENEVRANILSTPNIITLDNEEAKIVVGRNLPFVTGQYTNTGGGSTPTNPFQTIERRDVGLTLQVKPQISEGGAIRLQIYQEASAVVGNTDTAAGSGPVTTKRSIESMVLVDDGAIIALGGLVEDSYSSGEEKVPLLGDLPIAGSLFRYDTRKRAKTNLVVFLRPVILRERESYASLTQSRYDYVIGEQRAIARPGDLMRGEAPPAELPPVSSAAFRTVAEVFAVRLDTGTESLPAAPAPAETTP